MPKYKNCFFFTYLLIAYSVDELQSAAYGSIFDTITTNTFKEHKLFLHEMPLIEQFENKVKPYFEKSLKNQSQIGTVIKLTNMLLPKFMNGEIKIMN